MTGGNHEGQPIAEPTLIETAQPFAYYALLLLTLANFVNILDRLIPSILVQSIKTDLHLNDTQLGFLLGTALAVFFAIVGTAIGRTSDLVSRKWTMVVGLTVWSAFTALGGAATNFAMLSAARVGVGAGEAVGIPCSHSLLSDYFPARNRGTVIAVYLSGTFLGGAAALILGGWFLQHWSQLCTSLPFHNACALPSWKATLIAVGLPGLPLAVLIAALREPHSPHRQHAPLRQVLLKEFGASIPPFTILTLYRAGGAPALRQNLLLIAGLVLSAWLLMRLSGDIAQWAAIALGAYAIVTWGQIQKYRDPALYRLTFGCPTFVLAMMSSGVVACISASVQAWSAPFAMRTFSLGPSQIGLSIGLTVAAGSAIGVITGGRIGDKWKLIDRRAPVWIALICVSAGLPAELLTVFAHTYQRYLIGLGIYSLFMAGWSGAYAALIQDLVLPRMRGTAAAVFTLTTIVMASGAGPYWAGKISTLSGSLLDGLLSVQLMLPVAVVVLLMTARRLKSETLSSRRARAASAGEPISFPA
jgi:MFS family permease